MGTPSLNLTRAPKPTARPTKPAPPSAWRSPPWWPGNSAEVDPHSEPGGSPAHTDAVLADIRDGPHARIVVAGRLSWFTRVGVPALTLGAPRDDIKVVVTRASVN